MWLRRSTEANRNFPLAHVLLAAALGLTGALDEARTAARTGLALNAGFTIRRFVAAQQSDIRFSLLGSSASVKACASLACRKGDERFGSEVDFSTVLPDVVFGSISDIAHRNGSRERQTSFKSIR
jgi:hypothetical protein